MHRAQWLSIHSISVLIVGMFALQCADASRQIGAAEDAISTYTIQEGDGALTLPIDLPKLEGAKMVIPKAALPAGSTVAVKEQKPSEKISSLMVELPVTSFKLDITDNEGNPFATKKPLMIFLPAEKLPAATTVIVEKEESNEVQEFPPLASQPTNTEETGGLALLENLGTATPTPDTTTTNLDTICSTGTTSVETQEAKLTTEQRTAAYTETQANLQGQTVLASVDSSATVVLAKDSSFALRAKGKDILPAGLKSDNSGESTAAPVRVLNIKPQANISSFMKGLYSDWMIGHAKFSEDYLKFLKIMYENSYKLEPAIPLLKTKKLENFAQMLEDLRAGEMAKTTPAEQLTSYGLTTVVFLKNKKTKERKYVCLGTIQFFMPLRSGEKNEWSAYKTPYTQADFPAKSKHIYFRCQINRIESDGSYTWDKTIMEGLDPTEFAVHDVTVKNTARADTILTDNPTTDYELRRRDAMSIEPGVAETESVLTNVAEDTTGKTEEEIQAPANNDGRCSTLGQSGASALWLDAGGVRPTYLGKKTGVWLPTWTAEAPVEVSTLSRLTSSSFSIGEVSPTSMEIIVESASDGKGAQSYQVYYREGSFTSSSPTVIAAEGKLAKTILKPESVVISDLVPGTSYSVAVIAAGEGS